MTHAKGQAVVMGNQSEVAKGDKWEESVTLRE